MNRTTERRLLVHTLNRVDNPRVQFFSSRWFLPAAWFALVLVATVLMAVTPMLGQAGAAFVFTLVGFAGCYLWFRASAAKCWPSLAPHFNRQSLARRISELEP
jgi:hypothetical protein